MRGSELIGLPYQRAKGCESVGSSKPPVSVDRIGIAKISITQLNTGGFYLHRDINIGMLTEEERGLVAKMLRSVAREVKAGMPLPDAPFHGGFDTLDKNGVS